MINSVRALSMDPCSVAALRGPEKLFALKAAFENQKPFKTKPALQSNPEHRPR